MASAAGDAVDALLGDARLAAAGIAVAESSRRRAAGVHALAGNDGALAAVVEPELLACHDDASVDRYLSNLPGGPHWYDYVAASQVVSWLGDEIATVRCLRAAYDAAFSDGVAYAAVGARERLARHALLYGDVAVARGAIEEAMSLAKSHRLANWLLRCGASAATMALDTGDRERAGRLVDEACGSTVQPEMLALFAPAGAQLAAGVEDLAALRAWASPEMFELALRGDEPQSAIAATIACLLAAGGPPPAGSPVSVALRRGLLLAGVCNGVEFLSMAASYGNADEARLGVDALRAAFAPQRPYLEAHFLLARAHWCFRFGQRADAIDSAGDAARAFDAIGLRRWTDDAMLLLVHQEGAGEPHRRRRPTAFSLTGREQQVAHLIRRGASNREVARTLQISEHTVERHVSSILSRLGLRSRWQIVDARNAGNEH
jgi:DNA-binding CsgD family transcriptional regulator